MTAPSGYRLVHRKRVEFLIDAAVQPRLARKLHDLGSVAFIVLPAVAGEGFQGPWSGEGGVGAAGRYVRVVVELEEPQLQEVLELAARLVHDGTAGVSVIDIQVVETY